MGCISSQTVQPTPWPPSSELIMILPKRIFRSSNLFLLVSLALLILLLHGCSAPPADKAPPGVSSLTVDLDETLAFAAQQARLLDQQCADSLFPRTFDQGELKCSHSGSWTSGFFVGTLWQLYEATGDSFFMQRALARSKHLEQEQFSTYDHDLGFKLYGSYGHGLRLTGDSAYHVPILIQGAKSLLSRFDPRVGAIMSWDPRPERGWHYPVIIDNMMNLEYLCWATRINGDSAYVRAAISHADKTLAHHFRADHSSYHVVSYDSTTGKVDTVNTAQGFADDSDWARGQAWGLYGYTAMFRETHLQRYLDQAEAIADFYLSHPNLPEDLVPYWDFDAPDSLRYRDASAAAIAASALIELSSFVSPDKKATYLNAAQTMLQSLQSGAYLAKAGENHGFLLMHSVGNLPRGKEVDVPLVYADYYLVEALLRLKALPN